MAQGPVVRCLKDENSNKIWFFAHLFVPLTMLKVLPFEKTQIKFVFLLTYSYLCTRNFAK